MEEKSEETRKTGFLQEAPNKNSATRLVFVFGSFWNMTLTTALAFAFDGVTIPLLLALFTGIESALVALKVVQKSNENNK